MIKLRIEGPIIWHQQVSLTRCQKQYRCQSKQARKSFIRCFKWTERHRHATVCIRLQNRRWHPHPSIILGLTKVLSACVLPFMSEIWWWTWSCYPCLKDCRCLCRHTMLLFWSFLCIIHSCELYGSWDCTNTPCWFHYKQ
jgi:hypothetical protein